MSANKAEPQQETESRKTKTRLLLLGLVLLGLALRAGQLNWQPLWWDEGYSVYFATEPLGRMFWLTAHDIHPPLYYALLHGWLLLFQSAQPTVLRFFSVLVGTLTLPLAAWLARVYFPHRPRLPWLVVLLLLLNPMQLFYSQEVRMYGLALLFSIASTAFFWQAVRQVEQPATTPHLHRTRWAHRRWRSPWLGYVLTATLALYTLYYLALLLLAHLLWAIWHFRRNLRALWSFGQAALLIGLLYLPWLLYAAPKLILYVHSKVRSDNDTPLTLFTYLSRHLMAFTTGHLTPENPLLQYLSVSGLVAISLLIAMRIYLALWSKSSIAQPTAAERQHAALLTFLLLPVALGYLLNLQFPFFPEGGERLLLFILPYFLLLSAAAIDVTWRMGGVGPSALIGLGVSAAIGVGTFYTTPRYSAHDYRPLIRQVVQQGTDDDTVLALFPWQIGYWRAYAPADGLVLAHGPHPVLAAEGALTWGPVVQTAVAQALRRGALWFPEPLSFGSTLPAAVEGYLTQHTTNLANVWYSTTTRLSAWQSLPAPPLQPRDEQFGKLQLQATGVTPQQVASANQPLAVTLAWQRNADAQAYGVTLRLQDQQGHTWASRDYAPVGSLSPLTSTNQFVDHVGFGIPVGLPPGAYTLAVGVVDSQKALLVRTLQPSDTQAPFDLHLAPLTTITVTQPSYTLPAFRLPMPSPTIPPLQDAGLALLGYSGYTPEDELLAGESLELTLFLQKQAATLPNRHLYVSVLDRKGNGVAGWAGWPLPAYPPTAWPPHALVQTPVAFALPPTLASGDYRLIAGFLDPANGAKSPAMSLATMRIRQRRASFTKPTLAQPFEVPVQFGTHVLLLGYDLHQSPQQIELQLHWQVRQTLLPPHHIFVHLDTVDGRTLTQADGPPVTAQGPAPSGSWLPNEYLTTVHIIPLPATLPPQVRLHVGLYVPTSGQRLPASRDGAPVGDMAEILLEP